MKIIISGTTGVGKSTTIKELEAKLKSLGQKVIVLGELVVDSPFFDLYFNDFDEWAFLSQLDFLLERFKQTIQLEKDKKYKDYFVIYDRHFLEDKIFSELKKIKNSVGELLYNVYLNIYNNLLNILKQTEKPDFFILLSATYDTVMERMEKRGRELETKFEKNYWQDLYYRYYSKTSYRKIFQEYSKNFVVIDTNDSDPKEVSDKIIKYIKKRVEILK